MAIQFYLTDVGRTAALNATLVGLDLQIKHIAVGDASNGGLYNASIEAATMTALDNELERYLVNGGEIEPTTHTLRFTVNLNSTITADVYELGLFDENNVLFAVASSTTTPLVQLINEVITIITFGFSLDDVDNITLMLDVNSPLAVELINEHNAHLHPHAQYKRIHDDTEKLKVANGVDAKDAVNKSQLDAEALARTNADNTKADKNGDDAEYFKTKLALYDNQAVNKGQMDNALATTLASLNLTGKADLAGNPAQLFSAANATNDNHVVNRGVMNAAIDSEATARANADTALSDGKADKNGSSANIFAVKDGVSGNDAVNFGQVIKLIYPIGIIIGFAFAFDPNAHYTGTTWTRYGAGRTPIGYNSSDADFDLAGKTGGAKGHVMTLANLIEHDHPKNIDESEEYVNLGVSGSPLEGNYSPGAYFIQKYTKTGKTGSATPDPIPTLPPYIVVEFWQRTA